MTSVRNSLISAHRFHNTMQNIKTMKTRKNKVSYFTARRTFTFRRALEPTLPLGRAALFQPGPVPRHHTHRTHRPAPASRCPGAHRACPGAAPGNEAFPPSPPAAGTAALPRCPPVPRGRPPHHPRPAPGARRCRGPAHRGRRGRRAAPPRAPGRRAAEGRAPPAPPSCLHRLPSRPGPARRGAGTGRGRGGSGGG